MIRHLHWRVTAYERHFENPVKERLFDFYRGSKIFPVLYTGPEDRINYIVRFVSRVLIAAK